MQTIDDIQTLEMTYDEAMPMALAKVAREITPLYCRWIEASRFVILSTVGLEGTDASPRGDVGPVVKVADSRTLWLPDWRGNNRIDSLRNLVRDSRASLMFMVPGCNNVVRVNGNALITADEEVTARFERKAVRPRTVIVFTVGELYFQCAKALMRSALWTSDDESDRVPSAGQFIKEMKTGFDAETYDAGYPEYAKGRMW